MNQLAVWVATSGPAGYAPVAPGTVGSLVGLLLYLCIARWSLQAQVIFALLLVAIGLWASQAGAMHFGRSDPAPVVIDEVAGQVVTLIGLGTDWRLVCAGFLLFRVLDIIKPWPAGRLERLHGGAGIMADDLMVALYGQVVLRLTLLVPGLW